MEFLGSVEHSAWRPPEGSQDAASVSSQGPGVLPPRGTRGWLGRVRQRGRSSWGCALEGFGLHSVAYNPQVENVPSGHHGPGWLEGSRSPASWVLWLGVLVSEM